MAIYIFYSLYLVAITFVAFVVTDAALVADNFLTSKIFINIFIGAIVTLLVYFITEFFVNGNRYANQSSRIRHVGLVIPPSMVVTYIATMFSSKADVVTLQLFIGFCAVYLNGLLFSKFFEWHQHGRTGPIEENPLDIDVKVYVKKEEKLEELKSGAATDAQEFYLKASAKTFATVAILTPNNDGKPHAHYPTCKVNDEMDYLFVKGEPLVIRRGTQSPFKIWLVGSKKISDLNHFLSETQLKWPYAPDKSYVEVELLTST